MNRVRLPFLGLYLATLCSGCASLNYPTESSEERAAQAARNVPGGGPPAAPILLDTGFGIPEESIPGLSDEGGAATKEWFELAKLARVKRQTGKFDEAEQHLEQAAAQLASRPPTNAQRRAVHGMRARFAMDLLALGRIEDADRLADTVLEEAETEPEIATAATADLAISTARRREELATEAGLPESQLPLLRIALQGLEAGTPSEARMDFAFEISQTASREEDFDLARRGIDRAVLDARTIDPTNQDQLAALKIFKARIAIAQGDWITAEAAAIAANRIFQDIDAPAQNRAVAEATLARILAERGDLERARPIATGAQARLAGEEALDDHTTRTVLAELGRLERAIGNLPEAQGLFLQALELPGVDFEPDRLLVDQLTRELAALEGGASNDAVNASD